MEMFKPGDRLTSAALNEMLPLVAYKSVTTSRTSTTTATLDPDLQIAISADQLATYALEGLLILSGAVLGAGDVKTSVVYSGSSSQGTWMGMGTDTSLSTNCRFFGGSITTSSTLQPFGVNGGNFTIVNITGLLSPTSAGTLGVQWAQNTSSGTATNMRLGSWLKLTRFDA